ncbi:MAG TPA: type III-B CRISPR module RAMP protein Cmr4 [Spirochaetia bacterium]|nr:type III-B CRISPR module RAMP protein Cmr4 [Spirochaetia bacterium]
MNKNELSALITYYAISPIHAGSGASLSAVDLPIQRERHTNWPHVQASAVKGALRSHFREYAGDDIEFINLIFGSDKGSDETEQGSKDDLPGAIAVSDAKLLAFPVRSNIAPFVWVTCPGVLKRLHMDLEFIGNDRELTLDENMKDDDAYAIKPFANSGKILLEDALVEIKKTIDLPFLDEMLEEDLNRLILITDSMFKYLVENCTEIQTQIKIDSKTGTAKDGALRYQELLPSDSMLYSVVYFSASAIPAQESEIQNMEASEIKNYVQDTIKDFMQIGGDRTLGRGICRVAWHEGGKK